MTPDTQAVLLLCGELGQRGGNGLKPLALRQYNNLATWLKTEGLRPGDLLTSEGRMKLGGLQAEEVSSDRVSPLLERGTALALMVERWERSGLWVISRSDECYPDRQVSRCLSAASRSSCRWIESAPTLVLVVGAVLAMVCGSRQKSK